MFKSLFIHFKLSSKPVWIKSTTALAAVSLSLLLIGLNNAEAQIDGMYFHRHTTGDIENNTYEVIDYLVIERDLDGYKAVIQTNSFNGHQCYFNDIMQRVSDRRLSFAETDCSLEIKWDNEFLIIEGDGCRDRCGTRAGLMGRKYPLASRNSPPGDKQTNAELCEIVFINGESAPNEFSEYEQFLLYFRGVDLLECRRFKKDGSYSIQSIFDSQATSEQQTR